MLHNFQWGNGMMEKMGLRAKLMLLVAVPLLMMLIFGGMMAWQKWVGYQQQKLTQEQVELVVAVGEVTHELQTERGFSAGFINSKGAKFSRELSTQHQRSDEKVRQVREILARVDLASMDERFVALVTRTGDQIDEIKKKREQILRLELVPFDSFRFYTGMISALLEITLRTANQMPSPSLALLSHAKQSLLYLKENSGQERAILTGIFSVEEMTTAQYKNLIGLHNEQGTYERVALVYASVNQEKLLREKLEDPAMKQMAVIGRLVREIGPGAHMSYPSEKVFAEVSAKIDLLRSVEESYTQDILNEIRSNKEAALQQLLLYSAMLAVTVVLTLMLCVKIVHSLITTIGGEPEEAARLLNAISRGDLTQGIRVSAGDDTSLLASAQHMQNALRDMIGEVHQATQSISESASTLLSITRQLEEGSLRGSESATRIASAMEQMAVSIQQISGNADGVSMTTHETAKISCDGLATMQSSMREMQEIADVVSLSSEAIGRLASQSEHIAGIVNVIREVSDQTNLLALNAAIEAARAGEHGRGFAVVADEVRKLAERTSESTVEISITLAAIRSCMEEAQKNMTASNARVASGVKETELAGQSMTQIQVASERAMHAIEEISGALREQSATSTTISGNVDQIAEQSGETAQVVRTVAEVSTRMEEMSQQLKAAVGRFRMS